MHCRACGYENEPTAKFCGQCGTDLAEESAGASLVGTTILGRYTIRRVIAAGGMGVVYEAEQTLGDHSRTVAIKVLLPELSHDHTVLSRFTRECGIVAQLSHQNTVRVYDFGSTEDGTLFIAMEYVRGDSLAEAITAGPFAVGRGLSIIEQMCYALHEAHELGIVHRDLKPDNVMLTRLGDQLDFVKILDFGIAVRLSAGGQHETKLTQKGMILGTPPYMSPEQFTGASVKRQSDIYSLGIILYEILTGHLPFEADSPWAWAQRHLTATPPDLPSTMPQAVVSAVRAALSKDPAQRPSTTLDFLNQLYARDRTLSDQAPLPVSKGAGDTQPDRGALGVATARDVPPVQRELTARGNSPITVPDERPRALESQVQPSAAWLPSGRGTATTAKRKRRWLPVLITMMSLGVVAFAIWLAYWYDLIEFPWTASSTPPPLPIGLGPTGTVAAPSTMSYPSSAWSAEAPTLSMPPRSGAPRLQTRTGAVPKASSTTPADTSLPAASQTPPVSTAVGWPTNWPSMPSNLPSFPSSLPTLPTAIMGIPIPSVFQMGPAPTPSASAPASGSLR
jgi:serine/threonine-protein kinase